MTAEHERHSAEKDACALERVRAAIVAMECPNNPDHFAAPCDALVAAVALINDELEARHG